MNSKETVNKNTQEIKKEVVEEFPNIQTKFEAYTGDEPYLFVSYSHRDTAKVYPILDALHDRKYRIWYDEACENGNDFRDELRQRITRAEAVLLFVSKSSMSSKFCGMEIIVARENGKRLYPIFLDDEPIPAAFEILLANTHHTSPENMDKFMKTMIRDLPAITMDRLTTKDGVLERCEDNGNSIEVGEGIREIRDDAFKGRRQLKKITLPNSLETIGNESFRGCGNLTEMIIPIKTKKIGESAFRDCISMKKLVIENSCIKIGERAFENCSVLEDITLPAGLTEIYGGVFNSCKSLKTIELPEKLTILGESAFSDCDQLQEITIPQSVTKIDDLAFNGCNSLLSVKLQEGLKKIGKSAFKNCYSLSSIYMPSTIIGLGNAPFRGCKSLKSIKVDSKNKFYKSEANKDGYDVLFNKNKSVIIAYPANSAKTIEYTIPDSVTIISDWAFSECKSLNRVKLPYCVHEIGEGAFCNCEKLNLLSIPDSVTIIDDCAFRGCVALEKIQVPSSVTEIGWGLFDGCEEKVKVYCEKDSAIYKYCIDKGIVVEDFDKFEED